MALLMEIPGYKIIDTLGEGGMATVYLAIQESFEREVALKVMSTSLLKDPSFGERFLREARIVSRLVHPNIVTVYDVGVHEGNHYLSMEYVPGEDLKQRRYDLDLVQALGVVKDVARALDYAGRKGYVHRDVKPENIMLHAEDSRAVLMDFGIARATDVASGMTQTGTTMGTPHYMSPEQAKGAKVDPRSDIYSLGVVLFELVAGFVPYDADSAVAVGIMHVSDAVPRLAPHLAVFQPIIDKALAKKPDDRYSLASELIADLNALNPKDVAEVMRQKEAMPVVQAVDASAATIVSSSVMAGVKTDSGKVSSTGKTEKRSSENHFGVSADDGIGDYDKSAAADSDSHRGLLWAGALVLVGLLAAGGWYGWRYWLPAEPETTTLSEAPEPSRAEQPVTVPTDEITGLDNRQTAPVGENDADADEPTEVVEPGGVPGQIEQIGVPGEADVVGKIEEPAILLQQAEELAARFPQSLEVVGPLADIYRQLQMGGPEAQAEGEAGLQALVEGLDDAFNQALSEDNLARAREVQEAAEAAQLARNYQERLRSFTITESPTALLDKADSLLVDDQLTSPEGANALEIYRRVLDIDAASERALEGIEKIVMRYHALAQAELENGNLARAGTYIQRGLAIEDNHSPLLALQAEVAEAQQAEAAREADIERQRQQLLTEAQAHYDEGRLIAPREGNAYDSFLALQSLQTDSVEAQQGLARIERALAERIEALINRQELDEASLLLGSARNRYPQSQALFSMRLALEQAQEAASKPLVGRLRVSANAFAELPETQTPVIGPDRTIYLGFEYSNFTGAASVIQAVLYDSGRSLKIAQVPVIVEGVEGKRFFRIERPVDGFAKGRYHVDLQVGDKALTSVTFEVERL